MNRDAELHKLAHTLDVTTEQLSMLAGLAADDVRELRKQLDEALFQADKPAFARVATLSRTVPGAVSAKLTELALPPLIAARTAELIDPRRAMDMVGRISTGYLADTAANLDATRAPEVVAAIPPDRVAVVSAELARREEWVVIGAFVSVVTDEALARTVAAYTGEQLLRIGYVLDDPSRLDQINALLSEAQLDQMLAAAASVPLWAELDEIVSHLSPEEASRMAKRLSAAPQPVRSGFQAVAASGELSADVAAALGAA